MVCMDPSIKTRRRLGDIWKPEVSRFSTCSNECWTVTAGGHMVLVSLQPLTCFPL